MKKRLLSLVLTLCMVLPLLPATALAASTNPFTDVAGGAYYHDAVIWAKDNGVTGGTTATTFSPNASCTRGQVVTFLWRAKGCPEPAAASNPFTDVKTGDYYYQPVLWAVEQGITGGTSATTFSPAATCTSGQVVTFLWRSNGSPEATAADSAYYAKAVSWAAEQGLLDNMGGFAPGKLSPRSAIVTYLYRNAGSPAVTVETPAAPAVTLYKVSVKEAGGAPFRAKEEGAILGQIPNGTVVEVLSYNKGGYAKVQWHGYEVCVWADKLKKVDAPDAVCSAWAQDWTSAADKEYVGVKGAWFGAAEDYTRTITRKEMAELLVWIMEDIYGTWALQFSLPIVTSDDGEYHDLGGKIGFCPGRLVYWGVAPLSYFQGNLDKPATYGEMTKYLLGLMAYDAATAAESGGRGRTAFTKADIAAFGIGGNTSASSICTYEQVRMIKEKTVLWYEDNALKTGAAYEASQYRSDPTKKRYEGLNYVGTGTYTIQTALGDTGKHPYVTINANGQGELQSGKPQSFKVTYLGTDLRGAAYTIQTADGKYLALDGMAVGGSRLMTRSSAYRWYITNGRGGFLTSTENNRQALNVSGWGTKDGTPVISYLWNGGAGTAEENFKFYFEFAK